MSVNEIIKKYLPITKQKCPKLTTKVTHCQNKSYQYCSECHEHKNKTCNNKLVFVRTNQVSSFRWHLYFKCYENHLIIRWVIIKNKNITVGNVKN